MEIKFTTMLSADGLNLLGKLINSTNDQIHLPALIILNLISMQRNYCKILLQHKNILDRVIQLSTVTPGQFNTPVVRTALNLLSNLSFSGNINRVLLKSNFLN